MKNAIKEPDNFLICYFGDYWEGKSEQDFIDDAISENDNDYIEEVLKSLDELLKQEIKWKNYLGKLNIFAEDDARGKLWLKKVFMLLEDSSRHPSR